MLAEFCENACVIFSKTVGACKTWLYPVHTVLYLVADIAHVAWLSANVSSRFWSTWQHSNWNDVISMKTVCCVLSPFFFKQNKNRSTYMLCIRMFFFYRKDIVCAKLSVTLDLQYKDDEYKRLLVCLYLIFKIDLLWSNLRCDYLIHPRWHTMHSLDGLTLLTFSL